jgi:glucose/arabinose dehydrogenase
VYRFDGKVDERSARDLYVIPKPLPEHNAGNLAFGPDRRLYFSLGDGGKPADPDDRGQSVNTMLGKIHRIEILPDRTHRVPMDNPLIDRRGARDEIWAYGFRNPWRFSFDRLTGDLWIADVGSKRREEISFEKAGTGGGLNYGWNRFEGRRRYNKERDPPKEHVFPVHEYSHEGNACAVAGGFVYRGTKVPGLYGAYLFSDFCKGRLEALRLGRDGKLSEHRRFGLDVANVSSFGQDADGELYLLNLTKGAIFRIDPA